eukprot:TRINITY_DN8566_c0_g2_i1.p1 TRINITY_DN8566_c0_g2~~TRINITY_DN8566_c0_g2_i1.p1  ORF type:complete len:150 (+),score=39.04 TRINITY_DN8566_c0_g2_i1:120-569(+)
MEPSEPQQQDRDVSHINTALTSTPFNDVLEAWGEQKTFLRGMVNEFWVTKGLIFQFWWNGTSEEIREAMVETSLEDLPQVAEGFETFADVLTPELIDPDPLFKDSAKVIGLFEQTAQGDENSDSMFPDKPHMLSSFIILGLSEPLVAQQ